MKSDDDRGRPVVKLGHAFAKIRLHQRKLVPWWWSSPERAQGWLLSREDWAGVDLEPGCGVLGQSLLCGLRSAPLGAAAFRCFPSKQTLCVCCFNIGQARTHRLLSTPLYYIVCITMYSDSERYPGCCLSFEAAGHMEIETVSPQPVPRLSGPPRGGGLAGQPHCPPGYPTVCCICERHRSRRSSTFALLGSDPRALQFSVQGRMGDGVEGQDWEWNHSPSTTHA